MVTLTNRLSRLNSSIFLQDDYHLSFLLYIMVSGISKINVCKILFLKHAKCQVIELVRLQLPYLIHTTGHGKRNE